MCGRFVSTAPPDQIGAYFDAIPAAESLGENYNVAPTQDIYGVVDGTDGTTRVEAFHWGLVPSWAKERRIGSRMINARSETLAEKNAFKGLFKKKRILVPMAGFYEWKPGSDDGPLNAKGKPLKQPMFIHRPDDEILAAAGLWTTWKDPEASAEGGSTDQWLHSATIITTAANDVMSSIHDRMPVFVPSSRWAEWLDPTNDDIVSLSTLFTPSDDLPITMHPVSTDVNNVRNNRPDLTDPV